MKNRFFLLGLIGLLFLAHNADAQTNYGGKAKASTITYNGAPFFPLGFYYYPKDLQQPDNKELDRLVAAGFNTVHLDIKDSASCLIFLDQCFKKGLKVILQFGIKTGPYHMGDVFFVSKYKNHPALLGWSVADDANNGYYTVDSIKQRHDYVKKEKPTLNTFISVYKNHEQGISLPPQNLLRSSDVICYEMYPIDNWGQLLGAFKKSDELLQVEKELSNLQQYNPGVFNKVLVAIPQLFSWASYSENKQALAPSAVELRNITYTGLINGAKGVLNYSLPAADSVWLQSKSIAKEINTLKDVFLFGERTKLIIAKDSWIIAAIWKYQNLTYLIVSNLHKTESQVINYHLPVAGRLANVFTTKEATIQYVDGYLRGSIPAKDVQVYVIK
jgi:hypothetical protein